MPLIALNESQHLKKCQFDVGCFAASMIRFLLLVSLKAEDGWLLLQF